MRLGPGPQNIQSLDWAVAKARWDLLVELLCDSCDLTKDEATAVLSGSTLKGRRLMAADQLGRHQRDLEPDDIRSIIKRLDDAALDKWWTSLGRRVAIARYVKKSTQRRFHNFDEILQECNLGAFKALQTFLPEKGPFNPWAFRHMHSEVVNLTRRNVRRFMEVADEEPDPGTGQVPTEPREVPTSPFASGDGLVVGLDGLADPRGQWTEPEVDLQVQFDRIHKAKPVPAGVIDYVFQDRSWPQIAEAHGFRSADAARKYVTRWLRKHVGTTFGDETLRQGQLSP